MLKPAVSSFLRLQATGGCMSTISRQLGEPASTRGDVHAGSTSRDPPSLLQALKLSPTRILRLALHVVIVERSASRADEEGSREERRRARADFLDRRDRAGKRGGVVEGLLVEPGGRVSTESEGLGRAWSLNWIVGGV